MIDLVWRIRLMGERRWSSIGENERNLRVEVVNVRNYFMGGRE